MYHSLFAHIQKSVPLTADEQELIASYLKYEEVGKKKYLLSEGDTCTAQYFVVQGCLRMYFIKDNGTEQITQFGIDNWWLADYMSFTMGTPSPFYIQALERSQVIVLTQAKQDELLDKLPKLERYFRKIYQKAYAAAQNRVLYFLDLSGEEKYHHFASRFPEFVQRIPQYMLASYLGFTPEFLSRVRAKDH